MRRWPVCLLPLAAGCAAPGPAAPVAPPATVTLARAVGDTLATTRPAAADVAAADLIGLDVTWVALERFPVADLAPLDAQSSLTSAPLAAGPVLVEGRQTRPVFFGGGLAAKRLVDRLRRRDDGRVAQVGHQQAFVAPGTTVRFACAAELPSRSAAIAVSRPPATRPTTTQETTTQATTMQATTMQATTTPAITAPATTPTAEATFTVTLAGVAATRPGDEAAAADGAAPESAYVPRLPLSPGTPFALVLPWPGGAGPWTALAAYVEVLPDDPARAAASAVAWNRLIAGDRGRPAGPATLPGAQTTLRRALAALQSAADPRPALTYLSSVTQARVAGDVALVADATLLGKLRDAVLATNPDAADADAVGWQLDRTALLTLADALGKAPLPPAMVAALAVHAGEVGRHADTLAAVTAAAASEADLRTRLVAENYIALEDNAPAARVRAFDWLKGQGRAPADYDPLANARARRAAINRALASPGGLP